MSPWVECIATHGDKNSKERGDTDCRQKGVKVHFLHIAYLLFVKYSHLITTMNVNLKEYLFYK